MQCQYIYKQGKRRNEKCDRKIAKFDDERCCIHSKKKIRKSDKDEKERRRICNAKYYAKRKLALKELRLLKLQMELLKNK